MAKDKARTKVRTNGPVKVTSCGCLVYRVGSTGPEVLLVKPRADRDVWGVPKGHREPCENDAACAVREVKEETGIDVVLEDMLPLAHRTSDDEEKTVVTFLAHPVGHAEAHAADGENADVRWFSLSLGLPILHAYQVSVVAAGIELIRARWASGHI